VSTGTLDNWIREAAEALVTFMAVVAAQLRAASVVHADETSIRSEKKAVWVHVCCTTLLRWLHVGRRDKATAEAGPLGDYGGTVAHDRLAMYFNYGTGHVLCNAHILRSLNELCANARHKHWATGFIKLIVDTKNRVDTARTANKPELTAYRRRKIRRQWNDLCDQAARAAPPPVKGLRLYGADRGLALEKRHVSPGHGPDLPLRSVLVISAGVPDLGRINVADQSVRRMGSPVMRTLNPAHSDAVLLDLGKNRTRNQYPFPLPA